MQNTHTRMHACVGRKMKEVNGEQTEALFTVMGGEENERMTEEEEGGRRLEEAAHTFAKHTGESDHANPTLEGGRRQWEIKNRERERAEEKQL